MLLPNNTPTSSRHCSSRISAAAKKNRAAPSSSATLSVTRTHDYEEVDDVDNVDNEFNEEVAEAVAGVDSNQETQQSAVVQTVVGGKIFCDVDNCPGFNFLPGVACSICEADLHSHFFQFVIPWCIFEFHTKKKCNVEFIYETQ
jgi:hypothetical protein